MASAIDSTDIVYTAKKIHKTSPVATAALGRLLTAASVMGAQLKQKNASLTLRMNGDGPIGALIAVSDSNGNCRGYVSNPAVETERYENGKLNVAKAVGKNGILNVMRDYGSGDPYFGNVEIVSGEIAEDIANYYAVSEQVPTVCALGVLLDKESGEVLLAGGLLIQLLPSADDETIKKLEASIAKLEPITTLLAKGYDVKKICEIALEGFEVEVLDEMPINYICKCSREKVENTIRMMPDDEIRSLAEEKGYARANCHFCNKNYRFTKKQLEDIIASKKETQTDKSDNE